METHEHRGPAGLTAQVSGRIGVQVWLVPPYHLIDEAKSIDFIG
jgi:hypothetical protein